MKEIIKYSIIVVCAILSTACGNIEKAADTEGIASGKEENQVSASPMETSSALEEDESFFYDYLMKENRSEDRELYIQDMRNFGNGKWICAEWRNDGSIIEVLYMEKLASGEWEQKERDGYLPPISEGFLVYSGVRDGARIISIAANEKYWNMEEDTQETWDLDYVRLFFADGSSMDVRIAAGERKLLVQEEETEITDWKLYEKDGKEIYSCTEAEKNERVSLGKLFTEQEE